ncbi:putative triose-phosphate isomerase [Microlunatus phosphovorus NM-1]|uniref:Triosephosphate isomerase n=1 Tax=Microlunatus phosphovorus (strain ATCC 700054 / DSM 10555 / JCM 9379 / NBRC 101784 / NCIMB 13414 / VKM Ac-1990 / NM-1) TaxID=1032480 RepID=F5XJ12_MICPN|nr:triose-phosphate isomerase family protein [Microlunatus phosphovorus]BAK33338.1 putative triose-phosphate isomerase [Microlunatus phosphovorus NM-1]
MAYREEGARRRYLIGMSTKMYFSHARTLEWCRQVAELSRMHPAVVEGRAELFVLPGFLSVAEVASMLEPVRAAGSGGSEARFWSVGAQDACWADDGPYTGEVSAAQLAEVGARLVEVGHAERRRLFGEDDEVIAAKTAAILRHGLTPVLCIGETERVDPEAAVEVCQAQLESALAPARSAGHQGPVVIAYEPVWAIGASEPAGVEHIVGVCGPLRAALAADLDYSGDVIYGGSAGPGLLREVGEHVDGLFLGRFAHNPQAIKGILDDVLTLGSATSA